MTYNVFSGTLNPTHSLIGVVPEKGPVLSVCALYQLCSDELPCIVAALCVNVLDGSWNGSADHVSRVGGEVLGASQ